MHKKFDHVEIEQKWHARWREMNLYALDTTTGAEREYILTEFPYPSGNLHIGHWYAFAVPDIYVRRERMRGKAVLYPIGFDSFGLPAENAAIKHKLNPKEWTYANIEHMTTQLQSMGNAFNWSQKLITSDPAYYRWTQWIFRTLFEQGLAYRGTSVVNWCPSCNTVLANEQVVNEACERCGSTVEHREMPQWLLKITQYADRLIDDLDDLAWPEPIKESQRNWIGKSEGAHIDFELRFKMHPERNEETDQYGKPAHVTVFTTRPDTLYGATYLVLAPEHPWAKAVWDTEHDDVVENKAEVAAYAAKAAVKDVIERTAEGKEKTGVQLKGIVAINPATKEEIPVFVADYVLGNYGTGAVMAVPAHDTRDYAFAKKYNLPEREVVETGETLPATSLGKVINSGAFDGMGSEEAKIKITEAVGGRMTSTYRLRDWSISRQRYWGCPIPIVYDPEGMPHAVPEEHLPWLLPEDVDFTPTGEAPLAKSEELRRRTVELFGEGWTPEVETMDTFMDSSWYFLRYIDPENEDTFASKEAQTAWMPVSVYFGGAEHTTMHLLYSRFMQKALYDLELVTTTEPYTIRLNRGLVLGPDGNKMSKSKGNVIDPDEQVKRLGSDTVKMYLAFMGPYGEVANYPWDMGGIMGIRRFLERVYALEMQGTESEEVTRLLHRTIVKVTDDITAFKFNTAISALMIFVNLAEKEGITKESYTLFLRLLAPFAPHLADELWERAGYAHSIHTESWPTADGALLVEHEVTLAVQIDGKVRGTVTVAPDADQATVEQEARAQEALAARLAGAKVARVVYVPGRVLNFITAE